MDRPGTEKIFGHVITVEIKKKLHLICLHCIIGCQTLYSSRYDSNCVQVNTYIANGKLQTAVSQVIYH